MYNEFVIKKVYAMPKNWCKLGLNQKYIKINMTKLRPLAVED